MTERRRATLQTMALGLLILAAPRAPAQEGGIEIFAGETLFQHGTRISATVIHQRKTRLFHRADRVSDPLDRDWQENRLVVGVDHGVLPQMTLSMLAPLAARSLEQRAGTGTQRARAEGLGDISLLAKYRIFKMDWRRGSLNVSLIGGLELPTGETHDKENGVRLPPTFQLGSGSTDVFWALASNLSHKRFRFDGLLFHKINTEGAQDYEAGQKYVVEFDAAWRFLHVKYPGPTAAVKIGWRWKHEERGRQNGVHDPNSGYDQWFQRIGLGWHPKPNMDVTLSADIPLHQRYKGRQLAPDFSTALAYGIRF
jgi:hypothetical protein